jgi:hypothetical protein
MGGKAGGRGMGRQRRHTRPCGVSGWLHWLHHSLLSLSLSLSLTRSLYFLLPSVRERKKSACAEASKRKPLRTINAVYVSQGASRDASSKARTHRLPTGHPMTLAFPELSLYLISIRSDGFFLTTGCLPYFILFP